MAQYEDLVDIVKNSISRAEPEPDDDGSVQGVADENGEPIEDTNDLEEPPNDEEPVEEAPAEAVEEPAVEPVAEPEPPVVPEPAKEPAKAEEDELAGIAAKDSRGRENRIPYSAVVRINKNAVKKATEAMTATHTAEITKRDTLLADYTKRLEDIGVTERIMFSEPQKFVGMLIQAIPGYRELLGGTFQLDAKGHVVPAAAPAAAAPAAPAIDANDPEPRPDIDEGNGRIGYSPEQFAKLRAWDRRQAAAEGVKAAEAALGKTYKPVLDAFNTHQTTTQRSREQASYRDAQIKEAQTWPGWDANWKDVLKAMEADYEAHKVDLKYQFPDIKAAYLHVLYNKATAQAETRAQMETRIAKETQERLRRAPKSTSVASVAPSAGIDRDVPARDTPKTTAELVAESIRKGR